jgi:hypothetical protein
MFDFLGWTNFGSKNSWTPVATHFRSVDHIILFVRESNITLKTEPSFPYTNIHNSWIPFRTSSDSFTNARLKRGVYLCDPGDIIGLASDVLPILEAMKTEIFVKAGRDNVGKIVCRSGKHVKEGGTVCPGGILVTFI